MSTENPNINFLNESNDDSIEAIENVDVDQDFLPELTENDSTESTETNYYQNFYKIKNVHSNQSKRREQLLQEQKRRRNESMDISRGIVDEKEECVSKVYKKFKKYNNKLMMSEWLVDVPEDLNVNWFFKICPNGQRCLVVAEKHKTKCFNKRGNFEEQFASLLPGGDKYQNPIKATILDCIWDYKNNFFHVLDVLVWAGNDLTDYNAEFRFYWLQTQLKDIIELNSSSETNTYPFKYIEHYESNRETMVEKFYNYNNNVDGVLFFHKDSSYMSGRTPLVGWLKTYMIPEILNIQVNEHFIFEKPLKYSNLKNHIEYANFMRSKRKNQKMEIEETETEQQSTS